MKMRMGFVSNSSTTSFTCQVSGVTMAYSDSLGLPDLDASCCVNGHYLFNDYLLPMPDGEDDGSSSYERSSKRCPICQFEVICDVDLAKYLDRMSEASRADALAAVREANPKRGSLLVTEWIDFATRSLGKTRGQVAAEIWERFADYSEFSVFLKESG